MKKTCSWRHGFVLAAGLAMSFAVSAYADGAQDVAYQINQRRFFDLPTSARVGAMAGSSSVTDVSSYSILGNPAGLGWMKDAEVSGSWTWNELSGDDLIDYSKVDGSINDGYVLGAFPIVPYKDALPEYGNIGMGWSGYKGDADGLLDTDMDAWRLHLAYAKALDAAWSVGAGLMYQNSKQKYTMPLLDLDNSTLWKEKMNDGIRADLGAQYKLSDRTMFGLRTFYGWGKQKITNELLQDFDFAPESNRIRSWNMEGGVSQVVLTNTVLTGSVDYTGYWQKEGDLDANAWGFRVGVEQPVIEWLKLRAGYRYMSNTGYEYRGDSAGNAKFNAVAFGAGVALGKYVLADYAAEYRAIGEGDWSHWVTLSFPFSICE